MKIKFHFLLFCFVAFGFSSCSVHSLLDLGLRESNKSPDFTEKPKKILMYFESGTPLPDKYFKQLEKNLSELISLSNVEVIAIPYDMAALDGAGNIAQKIATVTPDIVLKISYIPPSAGRETAASVFDIKMLTPDQQKIQWRGISYSYITFSERWARKFGENLVAQLRRDGILD